jgi:DNA gyrase/topoisomerase IV subunit A
MRLHRLTELETKELKDRLEELKKIIADLYDLLDSPSARRRSS